MERLTRMDHELPNVRAALEYSLVEPGQGRVAHRIAGSLYLYWLSRGLLSEGRYWLRRAEAADTTPSHDRAQALFAAVALAGRRATPTRRPRESGRAWRSTRP